MAVDIQSLLLQQYLKGFFEDPSKKKRGELTLGAAQRMEDLSDLSLLSSMLKNASTESEFQLINKTNEEVQKRAVDFDPVTQAMIKSTGLQIEEDTTLFNQFKLAVNSTEGFMIGGEFEDIDVENMQYEDIAEKTTGFRRLKHMLDLGKTKGFVYKPKDGKLNSTIMSNRLDEYSKELDAAVYFLIDKGKGKNLPIDAKRAIQIGDLATLKEIKSRELVLAQRNYSSHSSRYNSLNNAKMDADVKKNVDDNTLDLMPATMMSDLKNKDDGSLESFMEAMKTDPAMYLAFMNGAKSGSGVTVDYDTYSTLLEAQMTFESKNVKEANQSHFDWTGSNVEKFREAPDYSKIKEELKKTGLQGDEIVLGDDEDKDDVKDEKITIIDKKDEIAIGQTDFDTKRFSNQPETFPSLKKAKGKFVFTHEDSIKEWDNLAYVKGFDQQVPVLNAGYDKYFWYNGKWRHMSQARRKAPVTSKRKLEEIKFERGIAFKKASEDIQKMAKRLGYFDIDDATKKTKGKPIKENVYNYSKSLWEKLPKETKAQFGSFNDFMEAVVEQSKLGLEIESPKKKDKISKGTQELSDIYVKSRYLKQSKVSFDKILKQWKSEGSPSDVSDWILGEFPNIEEYLIR